MGVVHPNASTCLTSVKSLQKGILESLMPSRKSAHHVGQECRDLLVTHLHDPGKNLEDAFLRRAERELASYSV